MNIPGDYSSVPVGLPSRIELTCPDCKAEFAVDIRRLSQRFVISCPLCNKTFNLYDGISGELRRKIYHAIRDRLEQRVFEQQQMDRRGYFEDSANLPPED